MESGRKRGGSLDPLTKNKRRKKKRSETNKPNDAYPESAHSARSHIYKSNVVSSEWYWLSCTVQHVDSPGV